MHPSREYFLAVRTDHISDAETELEAEGQPGRRAVGAPFVAMPSGMVFCFGGKGKLMDTRIAAVSIIVEDPASVEALNAVLHEYAPWILGRMGIPYREKNVSVICIALDAPADTVNALTGKIGRLTGVSAKAVYSRSA